MLFSSCLRSFFHSWCTLVEKSLSCLYRLGRQNYRLLEISLTCLPNPNGNAFIAGEKNTVCQDLSHMKQQKHFFVRIWYYPFERCRNVAHRTQLRKSGQWASRQTIFNILQSVCSQNCMQHMVLNPALNAQHSPNLVLVNRVWVLVEISRGVCLKLKISLGWAARGCLDLWLMDQRGSNGGDSSNVIFTLPTLPYTNH